MLRDKEVRFAKNSSYLWVVPRYFDFGAKVRIGRDFTGCPNMKLNLLRWNDENLFVPNRSIFSVLSTFKCNPGKTNDKFVTSWSFLSSDITPTSSKENESDELLYTVRSLVMVRATSCQRKWYLL